MSRAKYKSGFINIKKIKEWHNIKHKLYVKGVQCEDFFWTPEQNFLERIKISLQPFKLFSETIVKPKFNIPQIKSEEFSNDIVFHFTSRALDKSIPIKLQNKIISKFSENNLRLAIIGSYEDCKHLSTGNFNKDLKVYENIYKKINVFVDQDLNNLVNIILNAKVYIGIDSFPIHIADSYNIKIIALLGPTNYKAIFQSLENKFIIKKDLIRDISAEEVLKVYEKIKNS